MSTTVLPAPVLPVTVLPVTVLPVTVLPATVLPATVRVPPHRAVLVLGPGERVVGLDPATALVVENLPPPLAGMLDELQAPVAADALLVRAVERGASPAAARSLLGDLLGAGALEDAAITGRRDRHRAGSTVLVVGRGPLAVGIVGGLVLAGVGGVHADTGGTVVAGDLGTGFTDDDRGDDRLTATRAVVRRLAPNAGDTGPPPRRLVPDLVVLADEGPDPVRLTALHAAGVAHLPARLRDGVGVVGPLVLPGRSACLSCVELHRGAHDPQWPRITAQLVGRSGSADPACTAATAGLATAQALAALDGAGGGGPVPAALDATLELDVTAATLVRRSWAPHPECHCRAVPAAGGASHRRATSAEATDGDTIKG